MEILSSPIVPWVIGAVVLYVAWTQLAPRLKIRVPNLSADDVASRVLGPSYKAGKLEKAASAEIKFGNYMAAGKIYEDAGMLQQAVDTYVKGDEHMAAAFLLEKMPGKQERSAELFLKGGDYKKAAEVYVTAGKAGKAAPLFEEKGNNLEAARLYALAQQWDKAAALFVKSGYPIRAGDAFEKKGDFLKAAECYEKHFMENVTFSTTYSGAPPASEMKNAQKAGQLYEKGGDVEKAREIYLRGSFFKDAARVSSGLGQFDKAAEYLLRAEDLAGAADAFEKGGDPVRASNYRGEVAFKAGKIADAAAAFEKGQDYQRSAELFEQIGMLKEAGGAYEAGDSFSAAGSVYMRAGLKDKAAACYERCGEYETAAKLYEDSKNGAKAAELYEKAGLTYKSGVTAAEAGQSQKAIGLLQRVTPSDENYLPATEQLAELFLNAGMNSLAVERLQKVLQGKPVAAESLSLYYWLARAHEAANARPTAVDLYKKILSEDFAYRDVVGRVKALDAAGSVAGAARPAEGASVGPGSAPAQPGGRIGKYEVLRPLGRGAMGMVYAARDTVLEREVAIKVMAAAIANEPDLKLRFEREAKAVAKLTHPNIVTVHDLGYSSDGSPFIAMELLTGEDLLAMLRRTPPPSLERRVTILVQMLAGLSHAHDAGIVHRDIKPANIFVTKDGTAKLMDFGVARLLSASMTETGSVVGTADYMSPEQVKGAKIDSRSDIFSVGCVFYQLLAGRRPFAADNVVATFQRITNEEPDYKAIPGGAHYAPLLPVLKRALAKDVAARYQTAYDMAMALQAYLKDRSLSDSIRVAASEVQLEPPTQGRPTAVSPETQQKPGAASAPPSAPAGAATQREAAIATAAGAKTAAPAKPARFVLKEEIGRGPLGVVHRGEDSADAGKPVAMRVLPAGAAPHLAALMGDLKAMAPLQHPNLARVLGALDVSGQRTVVTELLQGKSLASAFPAGQKMPLAQAQSIGRVLASVLAFLHEKGLAHGSLQPSNVVSAGGALKLTDLGLGRLHPALVPVSAYRAPEAKLDAAGDVYAWGALLFHLLHGAPPTPGAIATLPAPFDALVPRCLDANPEARPKAREIAALLAPKS